MKKRSFALLAAALALLLVLAACGDKAPSSSLPAASSLPPQSSSVAPSSLPEAESSSLPQQPAQTGDKPDFGPLSDDLYAFQLEINGDVLQFPMTFEQFLSFGWALKDSDDESEVLDSNYRTGMTFTHTSGMSCYVQVLNFDVNSLPVKDCYVGGIQVDSTSFNKVEDMDKLSIVLPGGIQYGVSTLQEALDAYGTPSYENTLSSGTEIIEYKLDYYQEVELWFGSESGTVESIDIENFTKPADFVDSEVSSDVPDIVNRYTAPTAVSSDFADWTVEYGGKLYQLPAPVSEFEADGWVIQEGDSEMTINGRGSGWLTMRKDNQKLKIIVQNYSEGATAVNNCFVTEVLSDPYDCKIVLTTSGGITIGTTEADLKTAIAGMELKEEDSSSYRYYKVMPTGSLVDCYEFYVNKETGLVYKIEVSYQPKYADYTK